MVETLSQIFQRHGVFGADAGHADKGSTHSYLETYERILAPFRERGSLLEIGLAQGKSMDLWSEYFGPEAHLVGVDISIVFDTDHYDSRVKIIEADATKPAVLDFLRGRQFDCIIDDGSHLQSDQAATFRLLSPLVKKGGVYVIEDILSFDISGPALTRMHPNCEVVDLRKQKGRFDDILLIYRF
jgi:cephalosporin hydroxylase